MLPGFMELDQRPDVGNHEQSASRKPFFGLAVLSTGVQMGLAAHVFFALMSCIARALETQRSTPLHPFHILIARMTVTYLSCVLWLVYRNVPHPVLGPPALRTTLVARGMCGFVAVWGLYASLRHLSLSDTTSIFFISPGITAIAAWVVLREHYSIKHAVCTLISFAGVVLICKPSFLHLSQSSPSLASIHKLSAVCIALTGAVGTAFGYVALRKLGSQIHPLQSVTYLAGVSLVLSVAGAVFVPGVGMALPASMKELALLVLLGIFGCAAQLCLSVAVQKEKTSIIATTSYTEMIWSLLLDIGVFHSIPDTCSYIGSFLIVSSALYMALHSAKSLPSTPGSVVELKSHTSTV